MEYRYKRRDELQGQFLSSEIPHKQRHVDCCPVVECGNTDAPVFGGGALRGNETWVALRTHALLSRRKNSNVENWEC